MLSSTRGIMLTQRAHNQIIVAVGLMPAQEKSNGQIGNYKQCINEQTLVFGRLYIILDMQAHKMIFITKSQLLFIILFIRFAIQIMCEHG